MADRRKRQVGTLTTKVADLERQIGELAGFRQSFLARAPKVRERLGQADQFEKELATAKAEKARLEQLLESAKAKGYEPPEEEVKALDDADWRRSISSQVAHVTELITRGRVAPTDPASLIPTPPAPAPPSSAQPAQQDQAAAALRHFETEFATLAADVPGLTKHAQTVCDRWWNAGGTLSVDDAAQEIISDLQEKNRAAAALRQKTAREMPRTPGGRQPPAQPTQRAPAPPPPQQHEGRRPHGLEAAAARTLADGGYIPRPT